jgi:ketosteroid isomerase-like protein
MPTQTIDDLIRWFESLTPESAQEVERYYSADAYFKDPFNELRGTDAIRRVFVHMFEQVNQPKFWVTGSWQSGEGAVLLWDFTFRMKRGPDALQTIRGATHLLFAADGRVSWHRDYWDAAEELYEKLPFIGALMRFLRRRMRS